MTILGSDRVVVDHRLRRWRVGAEIARILPARARMY